MKTFTLRTNSQLGTALERRGLLRGDVPIPSSDFPPLDQQNAYRWFGLATSLKSEKSYSCEIEGGIPSELHGILYRNGPGLFDRGGLRKRCILDGDGMIQAFRISDGTVCYRNRFVRTEKYKKEGAVDKFVYPTWTTLAASWSDNWRYPFPANQAGITVIRKNGHLYAFDESQHPYKSDDLESLEEWTESDLGVSEALYAAHSKTDGRNNEWLHFGLEYKRGVTLHLTIFEANGSLKSHRPIPLPRNVYIHDYFVSERYVIFNLHPAVISLGRFITPKLAPLLYQVGFVGSMEWKPQEGNLILVVPREEDSDPVKIETEASWMWHTLNAYELGDEIIADFVGYDNPDDFLGEKPAFFEIMAGRIGKSALGSVRRYVINPKNGGSLRPETLAEGHHEFPMINPHHVCHPHRYAYLLRGYSQIPFFSEIVRLDTQTGNIKGCYPFGDGCYCSEPIFAPKPGFDYTGGSEDEPGWILTEVYNGQTRKSFLAILRAESLSDGPVAIAHLKHHAPLSFHGYWHGL